MRVGWTGSIVGIGVAIQAKPEGILIDKVIGTPAKEAGLEPGCMITAIEGLSTKGMTTERAVELIKGPEGSTVKLEIRSPQGQTRGVNVNRSKINVTETYTRIIENNVGLIEITSFDKLTSNSVRQALKDFSDRGVTGIILDLRDNKGGLSQEIIKVADLFIPGQKTLWFYQKHGAVSQPIKSKNSALTNLPLVVLINSKTLGGELLAAAIKRNKRGILVGQTTSGKALAKELVEQIDGSAVLAKVGEFYIERRQLISGKGVQPDVVVPNDISPEEVLQKSIQILRQNNNR